MARSNVSIYSALAANVAIAVVKFIAGGATGSSAMISEGVHSLVDSVNELLLLYGIYSSNKERDKYHPFGYGRELYFWSFIVAILIFALGAGVSFYEGVHHIKEPAIAGSLHWNYIVLVASMVFEGSSFFIALRQFRKTQGSDSIWEAVRKSKDPPGFMVLFEDGAALLGLLVVLVCLMVGEKTNNPGLDGVASMLVGVILTAASALLARESRSLLIGEGVSQKTEQAIIEIVRKDPAILDKPKIFSIYQSPDEVLLVVLLAFRPELTVGMFTDKIEAIKEDIRRQFPKIAYIIVQPQDTPPAPPP
jgi:cation diffusion facilitator family transporter